MKHGEMIMAVLLADINLVLQIVILVVLFAGLGYKTKGKFAIHGSSMLIAVVLNTISFFMAMGPSFYSINPVVLDQPIKYLALSHGILGGIAEILGVFLVVSWRLRKSVESCIPKKNIMRITIVLWLTAWILGILLYAGLYGIITI